MKLILSLLIVCIVASAGFADVIKPASVSGTIGGDAGSSAAYLLDDNPGYADPSLSDADGNAVTLDSGDSLAKALATFGARAGGAHAESWTKGTGDGNPEFTFDLGSEMSIGSVILWQYGNNGGAGTNNWGNSTKDFELIFHTAAEGDTFDFGSEAVEFAGVMDGIAGDVALDNFAQFFGFETELTAQYVGLRIASNYLGYEYEGEVILGGDRYGMGEVRFATETVPEPVTLVMLGLGGIGLLRRKK